MSVSDSAELAALAVEFVHSLDNVPHQVAHLLKEIEHKDVKCQELLPKVADRELQYRKLINSLPPGPWTGLGGSTSTGGGSAGQPNNVTETLERANKLADKIQSDYARLEDWSVQKAALSQKLWSILHGHHSRLRTELARVDPKIIANIPVQPPTPGLQPPMLAALSGLSSSTSGAGAIGTASLARPTTPLSAIGSSSALIGLAADNSTAPGTPSTSTHHKSGPGRRGGGQAGGTSGRPSALSSSGPSRSFVRSEGNDGSASSVRSLGVDGNGDVDLIEKGEGEEKDETPYCFCRQVSFGEMIGCDSDTCKIEWFHIGCVGVSKPLPVTWYCEDCLKQMSNMQTKKRKRQA